MHRKFIINFTILLNKITKSDIKWKDQENHLLLKEKLSEGKINKGLRNLKECN